MAETISWKDKTVMVVGLGRSGPAAVKVLHKKGANVIACDGKQATTIKLDQPIVVNDVPGTMFEVGAPMGHLTKYRRI